MLVESNPLFFSAKLYDPQFRNARGGSVVSPPPARPHYEIGRARARVKQLGRIPPPQSHSCRRSRRWILSTDKVNLCSLPGSNVVSNHPSGWLQTSDCVRQPQVRRSPGRKDTPKATGKITFTRQSFSCFKDSDNFHLASIAGMAEKRLKLNWCQPMV